MADSSEELLRVVREIRELLQLMAEPAIAQRDEKQRGALLQIVGKNQSKRRSVLMMDGSRSQVEIRQSSAIDQGDLSKLVKALRTEGLLSPGEKPQLRMPIPSSFFDSVGSK